MDKLRQARVKEIDKRLADEAKKAQKSGKPAKDSKAGGKAGAKAQTGEDLVMKLTFRLSKLANTLKRTGKEQALEVAKGISETCASAHINDCARHIDMHSTGPGKEGKKYYINPKDAFGTEDKHICTFATYKSEWEAEMKVQKLRNHGGGTGYGTGDDYHLELPASKIPRSDPACKECVDEYCRLVVLEGYKTNTKFEGKWKSEIKAPMKKYLKEKEKIENEKRIKELKAMRFSGTMKGSAKLFNKATKSGKAPCVVKGTIQPPKEILKEAGTVKTIPLPVAAVPKKGTFTDLHIMSILLIRFQTYENLSQVFIKDARLDCSLVMKGLLSYGATATATCQIDIALKESSLEPTGKAVVDYSFDGLGPDDHTGQIVYDIKGLKTKVSKAV
ncbi:MAG: hypothetical protein AB3N13_10245 [Arenibacterium sp.]